MGSLFRRIGILLRGSRHDADLREEIETHRQLRKAQLTRDGVPADTAERISRQAIGNVTLAREDVRRVWLAGAIEDAWQDFRIVCRGLLKSKTFSLVAIGTLALGIGANTALFSIFNSLLLRTLPVRDPGSLVLLNQDSWTYPIWEAVRAHEREVFDGVFAWGNTTFDLSQGGPRVPIEGAYASGNMFEVLGVRASRGRMLTPADDVRGGNAAVAVVSHRFWQERFGGSDQAIGASLSVERVAFTVVGVMPPAFAGPDVGRISDVILPFAAEPLIMKERSTLDRRLTWWLEIMGRTKPGRTIEETTAALRGVQPQIREAARPTADGNDFLEAPFTLAAASTGKSELRGRFETPLRAMVGAVALVLLIACANIANLLLARSTVRQRELSIRLALGASRWRVARLLLAESLVISLAGAVAGLLLASWGGALIVQQFGTWRDAVYLELGLDWRVLGFTTALACLSAVIAGLAPAFGVQNVTPGEAMKASGRAIAGDRRASVRGAFVVAQLALSIVLVIGAGLFVRTLDGLTRMPLGFTPQGLSVVTLNLASGTTAAESRPALLERIRAATTSVPGVRAAAISFITPITGSGWNGRVGEDGPNRDRSKMTWINAITPGWFDTMGIATRMGRDFDGRDRLGSLQVAIVNETFASRFLPGESPVGQIVSLGGPSGIAKYHIVGVVADAVYRTLREGQVPTLYLPLAQQDEVWSDVTMTVAASSRTAAELERELTQALQTVDPAMTFTFRTFDEFIRGALTQERVVALLSAFFGGLALLLAAIGLYGVVSHAVSLRRTEIGVRMALGAQPSGIVRLVFRRVAPLLLIGSIAGLALSIWLSRFVEALLFKLDPQDPATFAGGLAALLASAGLAAWIPARRAARVDPARALRDS